MRGRQEKEARNEVNKITEKRKEGRKEARKAKSGGRPKMTIRSDREKINKIEKRRK